MERRQLEFFLVIAEVGSMTRAAARLHIAQPSLSYAIRALESELGAALFERHGRGVRLTAAGEALLEPARRTLRAFSFAAGAVRATTEAGFGRLTVVANTLWAVEPLVRVISEYRRLHPAVEFVVADPPSRADVLEEVRSGSADFGVVDGPPAESHLAHRALGHQQLVAVLPPGPRHPAPITVDELVSAGLICTPRGTALRSLLDPRLESVGKSSVAVETAHVASVIPLVLAGGGVAVLPEGMAAEAAAKGARTVPLDPPSRADVHLVWRANRLSAAAEQLLRVVAEVCHAQ